jgi:hypothetical protein
LSNKNPRTAGPAGLRRSRSQRVDAATDGLERLTEPFDLVESDEAGSEAGEGFVDVRTSLVAHGQPTEAIEPSVRALHHPPVPAQPLAALDAAACDARYNPTRPALVSARFSVVGFVSVQLVRPLSRPAPSTVAHGWDGIEGRCHHHAVVPVGPAQAKSERRTARVGDEVALRARLAPVRRVRAGGRALFFAGTEALSRLARLQSICPAACRRSSRT